MNTDMTPMLTTVSGVFAPQVAGSAILLANLLSNYTGKISVISGYDAYSKTDPAFLPPCSPQYLALPRMLTRVYARLRMTSPAIAYRLIYSSMRNALQKLAPDVVLAAFPWDVYVVAAFRATRQLHVPFYAHMHDLWSENFPAGTATARFAKVWEPVMLKQSTRVLCMTEAMQQHYEKKYGIRTYLLPHTIPEQVLLQAPSALRPPRRHKPTVLFVGTVHPEMNLDALRVLAAASELLPQEYELLFCSATDLAALQRQGISSSRLRITYVSREEVQRLQSEAHVLVAPLSHKDCATDEVRTVFSTKLLEYLVSGRPIVVFAPEGSYHATSAKKNGWGWVVTEDSPAALAAAIVKVSTDEDLAARLVCGALQEARSRSAKHHAERLREWVMADAQRFRQTRQVG